MDGLCQWRQTGPLLLAGCEGRCECRCASVCVRVCVRACVRACMHVCEMCVHVYMHTIKHLTGWVVIRYLHTNIATSFAVSFVYVRTVSVCTHGNVYAHVNNGCTIVHDGGADSLVYCTILYVHSYLCLSSSTECAPNV